MNVTLDTRKDNGSPTQAEGSTTSEFKGRHCVYHTAKKVSDTEHREGHCVLNTYAKGGQNVCDTADPYALDTGVPHQSVTKDNMDLILRSRKTTLPA